MSTTGVRHYIIAAYYFPPLGLAGTARPLALANFLARQGHYVTVLTVKEIDYPAFDYQQVNAIDPRVNIVRCGSGDPARLKRMFPLLKALPSGSNKVGDSLKEAIFPDSKRSFVRPAGRQLRALLRGDSPNVLITTSPPVSLHQLGMLPQSGHSLAWIADFRDIWESLSYRHRTEQFRRRAFDYLEEIVQEADLITATSPKTIDHFREQFPASDKYHFLPNGYHEADFSQPVTQDDSCIGFYGTINDLVGIERVLTWISAAKKAYPSISFRLKHTGFLQMPDFDLLIDRFGLREIFQSEGFQPHHLAVQSMRRNRANIISLTDQTDTSFIIPSRLFELLRAEPPLIVVLPHGNAAREILTGNEFCDVHLVDDQQTFVDFLPRLISNSGQWGRKRPGVEQYEWQKLLQSFSEELDRRRL